MPKHHNRSIAAATEFPYCPTCHRPFEPRNGRQIYCSPECRVKAPRLCIKCQAQFNPSIHDNSFQQNICCIACQGTPHDCVELTKSIQYGDVTYKLPCICLGCGTEFKRRTFGQYRCRATCKGRSPQYFDPNATMGPLERKAQRYRFLKQQDLGYSFVHRFPSSVLNVLNTPKLPFDSPPELFDANARRIVKWRDDYLARGQTIIRAYTAAKSAFDADNEAFDDMQEILHPRNGLQDVPSDRARAEQKLRYAETRLANSIDPDERSRLRTEISLIQTTKHAA